MKNAPLLALTFLLAACGTTPPAPAAQTPSATSTATAATPAQPAANAKGPARNATGKAFASEAFFQGECVGGRGGCYSYTFKADGTVRYVPLDASISGTYVIDGNTISITTKTPETHTSTLTTTDDFATLAGGFRYKP